MYAIYTNELIGARKRRMPWRTVLELAKAWDGVVFTGDGAGGAFRIDGVRVFPVDKPFDRAAADRLVRLMRQEKVSRLYYTVGPGRAYTELQDACDAAGIELVWYMTSSWNGVFRCLRAMRHMGVRAALPYLKQALLPKRLWIGRLNRRKARPLVVMSDFTARKMVACGYPERLVRAVYPGLDPLAATRPEPKKLGKPYFLFFGPPQAIRGIYLALEAVRRLAQKRRDFLFVPLVRGDENAREALAALKAEMAGPAYAGVVEPHYESLSADEINAYIDGSAGVLKPFVLVPSEVPLAPMEAIQRGKPVIGFDGDGTGALIRDMGGVAVAHCRIDALADAMNDLLDGRCKPAVSAARAFADWKTVAEAWRNV